MEDRDKIDCTKPLRLSEDCIKNRKNFTQGYYYREIGRYNNAVPSEFQWAAEDKLINKTAYEELKCQLPDSPRATFLMVFSPDGKKVASTHGNHNVYVTDLTTGKNIQTLSGHPRTPWCIAFHPSSNQILASGCLGGQVRVWDLHGGSEVWTTESQTVIASLAFHPVDRMLVIATYNELHFWDWSQPQPFAKCSTKSGREKVRYVSFDRLGNKLITGIANPVNVPSQWDRINVVSGQPLLSSSTTTTTSTSSTTFNSTSPSTVPSSQPSSDQGRSITSWYRNFMNRYNQLVSISRNIPTIDRGTDPMDLLDLRSSRSNSDNNTSTPSTSTSTSQANSPSPLRFKITRSACRSYRRLERNICRERLRIHSSVFRRLGNRPSHSSGSLSTISSTSTSHSSVFTNPSTSSTNVPVSRDSYIPRLRRCAFNLGPRARSWCLTLSPENSSSLFSTRNTQSTATTGAVTNPTFTSYPERGIFSTRESSSSTSERTQFPSVQPYRLLFDDGNDSSVTTQRDTQSEPERSSNNETRPNLLFNSQQTEEQRTTANSTTNSPESSRSNRDFRVHSPEIEIEGELQRSTGVHRRRETESSESNRESPHSGDIFRNNRPSVFQLIPVNLRNVSPGRRFREEANSDGELTESSRREGHSLPQSLMHPRPVPRFQVRSRLFQDQQSQLHLLTNRETHGVNLQNNQNLRRQLSFRPGGQFVLSRHSNSPFQPRVPNQTDGSSHGNLSATPKTNANELRFEIPTHRSSFNSSGSSDLNNAGTSATTSTNPFSSSSVATNLSFTEDNSCHQFPEQINRRLYDRVKMMLRDRIRNSSENASTDSTVNYSRISGESEAERDLLFCEDGVSSRGLGPRGADPMLSSASENLDSTIELLHGSESSSPLSGNLNGASSNNNTSSMPQSELLDPWETDTASFSMNTSLPLNDVLSEQSQSVLESTPQNESNVLEQNQPSRASDSSAIDNSNPSSPEFSMRQGIELLSLHIENMQRLCWARIEILQLQKIRRMWEDLTNQIRHFHNIIQNRTGGETSAVSGFNENSNSGSDIPSMSDLAISTSPVPDRNSEYSTSVENSNDASTDSYRNNFQELVENKASEKVKFSKKPASNLYERSKHSFTRRQAPNSGEEPVNNSDSAPSRNEAEEPQPGPSGLSTPSTSGNVRNSILQLEHRVYQLLRDIIQKNRRRKESRELGMGTSSGLQRHSLSCALRNSLRSKLRYRRCNRTDSSRALSRELEAFWQSWKKEKNASKTSQTAQTDGSSDNNLPSTSGKKSPASSDACQSCGQKRRNTDSPSTSAASSSGAKLLRNDTGGRSEAPSRESEPPEPSSSTSSSQTQELSTNDLLKQMLQTMETMLHFQQQAFRSTNDTTRSRSPRQSHLAPSSGDDDSDSDQSDSNEPAPSHLRDASSNDQSTRESLLDSMQEIAQVRAKKLLGFMVKSLNQFFGKHFRNLNQVLDEQIFSLYMLLDLALELTSLLLEQLNAKSRDLVRSWRAVNPDAAERSSVFSKTIARARERNRRGYIPFYSSSREDNSRSRFSSNSSRLHPNLISTRSSSLGPASTTSDRFSTGALPSSFRRKRTAASGLPRWYYRRGRTSQNSNNSAMSSRSNSGSSSGYRDRSFLADRRPSNINNFGLLAFNLEINNNSNANDTNNNYSVNDERNNINNSNNSSSTGNNNNNNTSSNNNHDDDNNNNNNNRDRRIDNSNINTPNTTAGNSNNESTAGGSSSSDISNNNSSFLNYYFPNSGSNNNNSESGNNIIIVADLSSNSENRNSTNNSTQSGSNASFFNQNSLPPLRSMELTLSRNESGDLSLRDERPIFWIRYGGNNESSGSLNGSDSQSRISSFTVPVVQVNDVPVSDVSMLNQPRHRPQSPVPRISEDIRRWRTWRPRFLHPRYGGPNPFDDQDANDLPENVHYYRILSSAGSHLGVYTLDPMIIAETPLSPHHRIQAWDFSKMKIPDISDREANGVVPECKIHNDASVDVSNDGHLLVTLLPSGRLSVTTMLGVYSLDWSSLGQLLYRTSFEQNAVSVSLSPTNRHLLVGLASRPVVLRDRTNMAQIFRLEGGRPSPQGGSWQSGRGRLVHMRDLEQTQEMNTMSLNCIRWAPGAGQGLVYGTNTGQLKVLR